MGLPGGIHSSLMPELRASATAKLVPGKGGREFSCRHVVASPNSAYPKMINQVDGFSASLCLFSEVGDLASKHCFGGHGPLRCSDVDVN